LTHSHLRAAADAGDVTQRDRCTLVRHSCFANRNETKHLPYGEGTLRVEPLREALERFGRPATVISESPDAESTEAIRDVLLG
jgi:endonuclease IV